MYSYLVSAPAAAEKTRPHVRLTLTGANCLNLFCKLNLTEKKKRKIEKEEEEEEEAGVCEVKS